MTDRNRNSRKLLLEAAISEFAQRGFAGARTDRIAAEAGVNKQLIFYYFGSKAGLYEAVQQDARRKLGARGAPADGAGPDALRRHLRALFDALTTDAAVTRLIIRGLREREPSDGAARAAIAELVARFAALISEGQGTGYFRDDVDPELAARQAVVLVVGYLALSPALNSEAARGGAQVSADAWLDGAVQLMVRSLTW